MSDQSARAKAPSALRVLVVDDNDDNRNLLSRRLRSRGYEVDIAEDGLSALEACAKVTYDAVLLDVMMPGMSGVEVLEKLRKKHGKTELAVIMATAKNDSAAVVDALKRGANDYVTKPIDFPVLLARLEAQLAVKAEVTARASAPVDVTFGIAPGTVLCNRYEILEKRGEGGFAVVYRARQLSTNRHVALKHLRPDVLSASGDNTQLERFERESKLIGELNHPNVVRLIDSGSISMRPASTPSTPMEAAKPAEEDPASTSSQTRRRPPDQEMLAVPYIVMELLSGESLSDLIDREAPLEPPRAVDLVLPVLSALAAAHEKGVVHRDVKPSNIMLTADDRGEIEPKVLDFGIAKLTAREGADLTVSASLIGTPQYMSPEQALGRKDLDGRADQFSAASVLYQMLTGRSLYHGASLFELVSKVLSGTYTPLADARADLSPGLVEVVSRALSTDREKRHPSMIAFGRALLPYASERASRRWSDHFTTEPKAPTATEWTTDSVVVTVERSGNVPMPTPVTPPGSTDPTVAIPGAKRKKRERSERPAAISTTLASEMPPAPLAKSPSKLSWERIALIAIAIAVAVYLLSRYLH